MEILWGFFGGLAGGYLLHILKVRYGESRVARQVIYDVGRHVTNLCTDLLFVLKDFDRGRAERITTQRIATLEGHLAGLDRAQDRIHAIRNVQEVGRVTSWALQARRVPDAIRELLEPNIGDERRNHLRALLEAVVTDADPLNLWYDVYEPGDGNPLSVRLRLNTE